MRTVSYALLRPAELLAERRRCPVIYQPVGPLEWHGPHLPTGTDPLHAEAVACRAAEQVGGVVMPTLYWGTERERRPETLRHIGFEGGEWIVGMDFPTNTVASLYSPEDIFGVVMRARLDLLIWQSYRLVVIVNGHGATNHVAVLDRLAAEYSSAGLMHVLHVSAFAPDPDGVHRIGHADALETSLILALHPGAVDITALPALPAPLPNAEFAIVDAATFDGHPTPDHTVAPENDPRLSASAERGESSLAASAAWIAACVQSALADIGWPR